MRRYVTVRASTEHDLWHSINDLLDRGYQLEGGVSVVFAWGGLVFFQAMSAEGKF